MQYYLNESGFLHASRDSSMVEAFGRYPQAHRRQIDDLATNGSGDVKRLKGAEGCRLRIGDWRVIFIEDARSITVIAVGNRKEIYD
jgi:mRNA-degrading endonuclease RelE of RelBE toxin-antitoxin system